MNPILVVYTTREGQTRRIAEHIAAKLKRQGLSVNLLEGGHVPAGLFLGGYSAVILAAYVHRGKHGIRDGTVCTRSTDRASTIAHCTVICESVASGGSGHQRTARSTQSSGS